MKKFFILLFSVVLFTGCSLFSKEEKKPEKDAPKARAVSSENFDEVMAEMHTANVEWIMYYIPDAEYPQINKTSLSVKANITPPDPTIEKITLDVTSNGENDLSKNDDPKGMTTLKASGEMTGMTSGNGSLELEFRVVNNKILAILSKIEATVDGQPFPVEAFVGPYVNIWYGATFDEMNTLMADMTGQEFDMNQSFKNPNEMLKDLRTRLEKALNEVHMWKLVEALPEENGMLMYKVELDKEKLKTGVLALTEFALTNPDGSLREMEYEQAKSDIEEAFAEEFTLSGVLGVKKDNVRFFTFEGQASDQSNTADISMSWMEDEILVKVTENGTEALVFEKKGDDYTLTIEGKKAMEGKYSDDKFTGTAYEIDNGESVFVFDIDKKGGNEYAGTLSFPTAGLEMSIKKLDYSMTSLTLDMSATLSGAPLFDVTLDYKLEETSSVKVEEPESYEPFSTLIEGLMYNPALMGVPGGTDPTAYPSDYDYGDYEMPPLPDGYEYEEFPIDDLEGFEDITIIDGTGEVIIDPELPVDPTADIDIELPEEAPVDGGGVQ